MRIKLTFTALFVVLLALLAGCGGGQSGNHQSGDQTSKKESGEGEKAASQQKAKPVQKKDLKTALGTISSINAEKSRLYLRPTQGGKAVRFRVGKNPKITLNGRRAKLADVKEGQQASIGYFVGKNGLNRARVVEAFSSGRSGAKGGKEKTGG